MTPYGNGGCFLCFTDDKMNVAIQAQHEVKRLNKGGGSAVMVIDFWVAKYTEALRAVEQLRTITIDV